MILYTLESFWVFRYEENYDQRYVLRNQLLLIIFLNFTAFLIIFLQTEELKVLYIFAALILYLIITGITMASAVAATAMAICLRPESASSLASIINPMERSIHM